MTYQEFVKLLAAGRAGEPFSVRLTEADLLDLASNQFGAETRNLITDPQIRIQPDQVNFGGGVSFLGMTLKLDVTGRPYVATEGLKFELLDLRVNNAPAPSMVRSEVERQIRERLAPGQVPFRVASLALEPGAVQLEGTT